MELQIIYRNPAELKPDPNNSRTHSETQIGQIRASIRQFKFTNPILIDEKDRIIAGHGRHTAAILEQLQSVPTITLVGLTKAQKRAYVIADNKLALNAGWNFEMLASELDAIRDTGFDMSLLGFDSAELNDLIGTPNPPPDVNPEDESQDSDASEMVFKLNPEQGMAVSRALNMAMDIGMLDRSNNPKANGTALAFIAEMFITQNAAHDKLTKH
jgi:ParB family chromosome partitioning protein